ncbi:MAG: RNA pseudouridine synthase [Campylobacterales bacterium]|nr:RNA pseudouridine synthase [Campylobacterales bacterium]
MKKSPNDYRGQSKKLEAKNKIKSRAFAKKDAGRKKAAPQHAKNADEQESRYVSTRPSGPSDKAYKLLAAQEGISNAKAKELIDRGLVYVGNQKVMIARGELSLKTEFRVQKVERIRPIFENDDLIVVDKPAFLNADEVERQFKGTRLLHRLDRETSGVLMLVKNEAFREKAIEAFKNDEVYKEYIAWVEGVVTEEAVMDEPILTEKRHGKAHSKISKKGKPAVTEIFPLEVSAKKSKLKLIIHHGRTHQIRVHLRAFGHPIIGDEQYGGRRSQRVMLHAKKVELLGMTFETPEPKLFIHFSA